MAVNSWISTTPKPVPVRFLLSAPPLAPVTAIVPGRVPRAVGLNTMATVQDKPGAKDVVGPQVEPAAVVEKSPVIVTVMIPVSCTLPLSLATVHDLGVEVSPTTVSSKGVVVVAQLTVRVGRSMALPLTGRVGDVTVGSFTVKFAVAPPRDWGL